MIKIHTILNTFNEVCACCRKNKSELPELKFKRCGGCNSVLYCTSKDQKKDWPEHQLECSYTKKKKKKKKKSIETKI